MEKEMKTEHSILAWTVTWTEEPGRLQTVRHEWVTSLHSLKEKGNLLSLIADLLAETPQAKRKWGHIFKTLKGKNLQPKLVYTARISFKIDIKEEQKNLQTSKS